MSISIKNNLLDENITFISVLCMLRAGAMKEWADGGRTHLQEIPRRAHARRFEENSPY